MFTQRYILALLLLLLVNPISPNTLHAQNSPPKDLDIIFILDQSGSMMGHTLSNNQSAWSDANTTDPNSYAIEAVNRGYDAIVSRVAEQRLTSTKLQVRQKVRFGMVTFGKDVNTIMPLTQVEFEFDANGQGSVKPKPADLPQTHQFAGDATRFSLAFNQVCEMLDGGTDCQNTLSDSRERLLVLLTDGAPEDGQDAAPNLPERLYTDQDQQRYFSALQQSYAKLFDSSELWVLGIDSAQKRFWESNKPYWAKVGPRVHTKQLTTPSDATDQFQDILDQAFSIKTKPQILQCSPAAEIEVPPYTAVMTVLATYPNADDNAQITPPNGPALSNTTTKADINQVLYTNRSKYSQFWLVARPTSGTWSCPPSKGQATLRVRIGSSLIANLQIVLLQPPASRCEKDAHIRIMPVDYNDHPVSINPNATLSYKVTNISGTALAPQSADEFILPIPDAGGQQPLSITMQIGNDALSTKDFRANTPALPRSESICMIEVLKPSAGSAWLLNGDDIPFIIRAQDRKGQTAITAPVTLTLSINNQAQAPRVLVLNNGVLTTTLPGLNKIASYQITGTINDVPVDFSFRRVRDFVRWRTDLILALLTLLITFLITFLLFRVLSSLNDRPPAGTLVFQSHDKQERINLSQYRSWGAGWTEIKLYSQNLPAWIGLQKCTITNNGNDINLTIPKGKSIHVQANGNMEKLNDTVQVAYERYVLPKSDDAW